jgi:hypothetical protein
MFFDLLFTEKILRVSFYWQTNNSTKNEKMYNNENHNQRG